VVLPADRLHLAGRNRLGDLLVSGARALILWGHAALLLQSRDQLETTRDSEGTEEDLRGPGPSGGVHLKGPGPSGGGHLKGPGPSGGGHLKGPGPSGGGHLKGPGPSGGGHLKGPGPSGGGHLKGPGPSGGGHLKVFIQAHRMQSTGFIYHRGLNSQLRPLDHQQSGLDL